MQPRTADQLPDAADSDGDDDYDSDDTVADPTFTPDDHYECKCIDISFFYQPCIFTVPS